MSLKRNIYIVDDDRDDRDMIREAFQVPLPDYSFELLEDGDRLIEHLEKNFSQDPPALILLDLNMPGKDGRETLKEIKSKPAYFSIPIIIFTTSSSPRDKKLAYESGANCFISKPDTFDKLIEFAECVKKLWLSH